VVKASAQGVVKASAQGVVKGVGTRRGLFFFIFLFEK
jgi:hypothetical protein